MKWLEGYQCWVFDDGRVAVPSENGLKYRNHVKSGNGYIHVTTHGNKMVGVHRLLALAFISNPENKPHVDHIDRNKENFSLDNLRWVTQKENLANCERADNSIAAYGIKPSIDRKEYSHRWYLAHRDAMCARSREYRHAHHTSKGAAHA
jgi:hypothetical protein